MKWKDLKVYHPLKKEDIKSTYKIFTNIIYKDFEIYGFKQIGRKLYRKSEDLFHIIEIDTRGSWLGNSESFKMQFEIVSIFDVENIVNNYTFLGGKIIEDFVPNIRNHYRINQEYELLAEFLIEKITKYVLPYFDNYKNSKNILLNAKEFKYDRVNQINENLILYCELTNRITKNSISIVENRIEKHIRMKVSNEIISQDSELLNNLKNKNWEEIYLMLKLNREKVFKKLKIKETE